MDSEIRPILVSYIIAYVVATLAVFALSWGLFLLTSIDLRSSVAAVPLMIGALAAGAGFARRTGQRPGSVLAWRVSVWFTLVALIVLFCAATYWWPVREILETFDRRLLGVLMLIIVLFIIAARIFFTIGAKSRLNSQSHQ